MEHSWRADHQLRRPRILVAEDDFDMRALVIETLRADGYDAIDVTDGGELLVHITSLYRLRPDPDPIDLVVTDICMPGCSGLEIVQGLREAEWKTPIVIMTACGDDDTRQRAQQLDAVLLTKPFKMPTLRAVVRDLLAGRFEKGAHPKR